MKKRKQIFNVSQAQNKLRSCPYLFEEWSSFNEPSFDNYNSINKESLWKCKFNHYWEAKLSERIKYNRGCPYCEKKLPCYNNNITTTHPLMLQYWSERNLNKPDQYTFGSHEKIIWKCSKGLDHYWRATINTKSGLNSSGCPFCSGVHPSTYNNIKNCRIDLVKEWSSLNSENPEHYTVGSGKNIIWRCKFNHYWLAKICDRSSGKSNCPYCCGHLTTSKYNLAYLRPDITKYWSNKNKLNPEYICPGSNLKVYWKCEQGHEILAPVVARAMGYGCLKCNGKTSKIANEWLDLLDIKIREQNIYLSSKPGRKNLPVDGYDHDNKIVYEFLGDYFHGNPIRFNHDKKFSAHSSFGDVFNKTIKKNNYIKSSGYKLVYIWESEFNSMKNMYIKNLKLLKIHTIDHANFQLMIQ